MPSKMAMLKAVPCKVVCIEMESSCPETSQKRSCTLKKGSGGGQGTQKGPRAVRQGIIT